MRNDLFTTRRRAVTGRVTGPGGEPITGARVSLVDGDGRRVSTRRTTRRGRYGLVAPPGRMLLVVGATGHLPQVAPVVITPAETTRADVTLKAEASLTGRIRDESLDEPLPGAVVVVTDVAGSVLDAAVTSADGQYSFGGLDTGTYTMCVAHQHYSPVTHTVSFLMHQPATVDLALPYSLFRIRGTVQGPDHRPAAGVRIVLTDDAGLWFAADTDRLGRYEIRPVPSGTYTLSLPGHPSRERRLVVDGDHVAHDVVLDRPSSASSSP